MTDVERVEPDDLSPVGAMFWEAANDPDQPIEWTSELVRFLKSPPPGERWVIEQLKKDQVVSLLLRSRALAASGRLLEVVKAVELQPADLIRAAENENVEEAVLLVPIVNLVGPSEYLWSPSQLAEWAELAAAILVERIADPLPTDFLAGEVAWAMSQASSAPPEVDEALVNYLLGRPKEKIRSFRDSPELFRRASLRNAFARTVREGATQDRLKAAEFLALAHEVDFAADLAAAAAAETDPEVRQQLLGHLETLGFWLDGDHAVSIADAQTMPAVDGASLTTRNVIAVDYNQFYIHRITANIADIDGAGEQTKLAVDGDRAYVPAGTTSGHVFATLSMHADPLGEAASDWQHVVEGSLTGNGALRVQGWDDIEMGQIPLDDEIVRIRVHWRHHEQDLPFVAVSPYPGEWKPTPTQPAPPFDSEREEIWIAVWVEPAARGTEVLIDSTS